MSLQISLSESLASIDVPHEKIHAWNWNFDCSIIGGISTMLHTPVWAAGRRYKWSQFIQVEYSKVRAGLGFLMLSRITSNH